MGLWERLRGPSVLFVGLLNEPRLPATLGAPRHSHIWSPWHLSGHPWLPLGPLQPVLGFPEVAGLLISGSLVFLLMPSALPRRHLASPEVPQNPLGQPKCNHLNCKTNDVARPPVRRKLPLKGPLAPQSVPPPPKGPTKAPARPPGVP